MIRLSPLPLRLAAIGMMLALAAPAMAQTEPAPPAAPAAPGLPAIPELPGVPSLPSAETLKQQGTELLNGAKDSAVDAGAGLAKDVLPSGAAPYVDAGANLAKGAILATPGGLLVTGAEGLVYNLSKGVADALSDTKQLKADVKSLQEENAKKDIDIQFLKAKVKELETGLDAANRQAVQQNAAVTEKFAQIEARLDALDKERGTFRAPFKVVGAGGKIVLQVDPDGHAVFQGGEGGGRASLVFAGSSASFVVAAPGGGTVLLDSGDAKGFIGIQSSEEAQLRLESSAASSTLTLRNAVGETELAAGDAALGLRIAKGGSNAAGLGSLAGKPVALRIYGAGGSPIVAGGENPATPGTGILYVGDGSKNKAALAVDGAHGGIVHAFAPDGTVGAGLVGADRAAVAYNAAGAPVATISKSNRSEGGNVTARNPGGEGIFSAGYAADYGGGEACVWRAKRSNTFCLGLGLPGMGVGK